MPVSPCSFKVASDARQLTKASLPVAFPLAANRMHGRCGHNGAVLFAIAHRRLTFCFCGRLQLSSENHPPPLSKAR